MAIADLAYVYDVTVAYPYALTESELRMATGHCPQEVHFHVRRWPAHQLPRPTDAPLATNGANTINTSLLARWVQERWAEKEQMLKDYYGRSSFTPIYDVDFLLSPTRYTVFSARPTKMLT